MYEKNYGDENFFELGRLVQQGDSNTEFEILACDPIQDEEGASLRTVQIPLDHWPTIWIRL